jgi:hypothetical protein
MAAQVTAIGTIGRGNDLLDVDDDLRREGADAKANVMSQRLSSK